MSTFNRNSNTTTKYYTIPTTNTYTDYSTISTTIAATNIDTIIQSFVSSINDSNTITYYCSYISRRYCVSNRKSTFTVTNYCAISATITFTNIITIIKSYVLTISATINYSNTITYDSSYISRRYFDADRKSYTNTISSTNKCTIFTTITVSIYAAITSSDVYSNTYTKLLKAHISTIIST